MWFYSSAQQEYDFLKIERKWQKRWRDAKIFEADPDPKKRKFFITVPYPYTSGPLHIGHGRTYTLGDIYARYIRMQGYNTLFPMAFHITGTPILAIARRLAAHDPEYQQLYKEYVGIYIDDEKEIEKHLASFGQPRSIADFFSKYISQDFQAMGYSIDWRRTFSTGDPDYQAFVTWQFNKLYEAGYIKQGRHPLLYCLTCQNAVGEDDIEAGDVIGAKVAQLVGVKFPIEGPQGEFFVAATLRPETVFGCTNLWVNPSATYVKAMVDGETWIVSEDAIEKLQYQDHNVEHMEKVAGRDLVGTVALNPATKRQLPVLPGDFVDQDHATGVVYSVPAHAPYDLVALQDLARDQAKMAAFGLKAEDISTIRPISIIEVEGYGEIPAADVVKKVGVANQMDKKHLDEATSILYEAEFYHGKLKQNCNRFAGSSVSEAKEQVARWLQSVRLAATIYETSVKPVKCKDGGKVIAAVLSDQWFLNYGDPIWKQTARHALDNMAIHPQPYRRLFENTFDWLDMRPCARRRGIGTPLPIKPEWIIESLSDSTIYMALYTIAHHIRTNQVKPEQLKPEVFDHIFLGQGDATEISRNAGIPPSLLETMRDEFARWYPVDLRHTAIGHITNHLSFFIFHHAAIFPPPLWPHKITLNEFLTNEGAKMSKSKGNVVPLAKVPRTYGADLVRLYMAYAADLATVMDWSSEQLSSVKRSLARFWRLVSTTCRGKQTRQQLAFISSWALSRMNSTIEKASLSISQHSFREYAQAAFFDFMNLMDDFMKWSGGIEEDERRFVLDYAVDRWIRILAPLTPHMCEELWERRGGEGFVSTAPWPTAEQTRIDKQAEADMILVLKAVEDAREILNVTGAKATRLFLYVAPVWKFKALTRIQEVGQEKPVREIMSALMADAELKEHGKEVAGLVSQVKGGWKTTETRSQETEVEAYKKGKEIIQLETGLRLDIAAAEGRIYDPKGKAKAALPGRPALYLE